MPKKHAKRKSKVSMPNNDRERYPSTWIISRTVPFPNGNLYDNSPANVVDGGRVSNVLVTSTTINSFGALSFTLSGILPDYANWVAVYDQYRIFAVEVTFILNQGTGAQGEVFSVIDYDDTNNLGSLSDAMAYPNVIVSNLNNTVVRSFRPHVAVALYGGSTFTSYGNVADQWIDAASPGVPHYGIKWCATPTQAVFTYDALVRMHVQFRNPR
jgi:hypothetical protein